MCKRWENVQGIVMGEHQVKKQDCYISTRCSCTRQVTFAQDKVHFHKTSYICTRQGTFAQDKVHLRKTRYICTRQGTFAQDKLHLRKTRYICTSYICTRQGTFAQSKVHLHKVVWYESAAKAASVLSDRPILPLQSPNHWCNTAILSSQTSDVTM